MLLLNEEEVELQSSIRKLLQRFFQTFNQVGVSFYIGEQTGRSVAV